MVHLPFESRPVQQALASAVGALPSRQLDPSENRQPEPNVTEQHPVYLFLPAGRQRRSLQVKPVGSQNEISPAQFGSTEHRSPMYALVALMQRRPRQLPEQQSESYSHQLWSGSQHVLPPSPTRPGQQFAMLTELSGAQVTGMVHTPSWGPASAGLQKPLRH